MKIKKRTIRKIKKRMLAIAATAVLIVAVIVMLIIGRKGEEQTQTEKLIDQEEHIPSYLLPDSVRKKIPVTKITDPSKMTTEQFFESLELQDPI